MLGMLQIPLDFKENLGWVTGWIPDTEKATPESSTFVENLGMRYRAKIAALSREFWMVNKLFLPIFNHTKLIPSNVDFQIFLYRASRFTCKHGH